MTTTNIRTCSYVFTTRLVHGEPNLPTGSRVWVQQKSGTKRTGVRYRVIADRPGVEDCSDVQRIYWVDEDALSNEPVTA